MTQMKTCNLDVNDSGGWRRVMQFNAADDSVSDQVLQAADMLLKNSNYSRLRARIIIPGDTAALMVWERATGWLQWRHPSEREATLL